MTRAFRFFNKKRGGQTFDTIEENPEEMRTSSNFKGRSIEGSLNREEKAFQMSPKSTQSLDFFGTSTKDQEKCKKNYSHVIICGKPIHTARIFKSLVTQELCSSTDKPSKILP